MRSINAPEGMKASFLSHLLAKRAMVQASGHATGNAVGALLMEVDRQIAQSMKSNPMTGEGVTKSGKED